MFTINDYKTIISKFWTKLPENYDPKDKFENFESIFSIDIGEEFNSKTEKLKWLSYLNSYRNLWAHEGTKGKGLNKEEVKFLKLVAQQLSVSL